MGSGGYGRVVVGRVGVFVFVFVIPVSRFFQLYTEGATWKILDPLLETLLI